MDPDEVKRIIEQGLIGAEVRVTGDGRHFEAVVVADAFAGKGVLQQHRMVYDTLGNRFEDDVVHALSIKTYTPEQWARLGNR